MTQVRRGCRGGTERSADRQDGTPRMAEVLPPSPPPGCAGRSARVGPKRRLRRRSPPAAAAPSSRRPRSRSGTARLSMRRTADASDRRRRRGARRRAGSARTGRARRAKPSSSDSIRGSPPPVRHGAGSPLVGRRAAPRVRTARPFAGAGDPPVEPEDDGRADGARGIHRARAEHGRGPAMRIVLPGARPGHGRALGTGPPPHAARQGAPPKDGRTAGRGSRPRPDALRVAIASAARRRRDPP